jgi:energy-coupling factor transport system ATP-binding protein
VIQDRPAQEVLRDVELLEETGIMPLQVARFFHERGLPQEQLPLTPEEGMEEFRRLNWRVSPERHEELLAADRAREEGFGEPLVEVKGLTYRYPNGVVALEGVDLAWIIHG